MSDYERYCKIRDLRGLKDAQVASLSDIGKSTFSDWKNGRSVPKDDKIRKISNVLNVSPEFLKGDSIFTTCTICGMSYDPLNEYDHISHENFHNKILDMKKEFDFFMLQNEADRIRENSIRGFRDKNKTTEERLVHWEDYLKASFSILLARMNYETKDLDYNDFCKTEVATLEPDYCITDDLIEILINKYGVNKEFTDFVNEEAQFIARISKNKQLMRMMQYAESLPPEVLDSLEIQIEALVKNLKRG